MAHASSVAARLPEAVQGKAQTCEQQTIWGLLVWGMFEPCVACRLYAMFDLKTRTKERQVPITVK